METNILDKPVNCNGLYWQAKPYKDDGILRQWDVIISTYLRFKLFEIKYA